MISLAIVCSCPNPLNTVISPRLFCAEAQYCDVNRRVNVWMGHGECWVGLSVIWFRARSNQEWQFTVSKRWVDWCIMHEWPVFHKSRCFNLHCEPLLLPYYTQLTAIQHIQYSVVVHLCSLAVNQQALKRNVCSNAEIKIITTGGTIIDSVINL